LRKLKISDLEMLSRLEAAALQPLSNLEELEAHGYPRLGYLDVKVIYTNLALLICTKITFLDSNSHFLELIYDLSSM
jgi:hypothetical protein